MLLMKIRINQSQHILYISNKQKRMKPRHQKNRMKYQYLIENQ